MRYLHTLDGTAVTELIERENEVFDEPEINYNDGNTYRNERKADGKKAREPQARIHA